MSDTTQTDVMTVSEMREVLRRDEAHLADAKAQDAKAEQRYQHLVLNTTSPEAKAIAERDGAAEREAVRRHLKQTASSVDLNGRTILRQLQSARPALSAEEEQVASRRQPLVAAICEASDITRLRDEIAAAIRSEDRATGYLFTLLAPARLEVIPDDPRRPQVAATKAEIRGMLGRIRDELRDTSLDGLRKAVNAQLGEAQAVSAAEMRRQYASRPLTTADGRQKVRWPTEKAS